MSSSLFISAVAEGGSKGSDLNERNVTIVMNTVTDASTPNIKANCPCWLCLSSSMLTRKLGIPNPLMNHEYVILTAIDVANTLFESSNHLTATRDHDRIIVGFAKAHKL